MTTDDSTNVESTNSYSENFAKITDDLFNDTSEDTHNILKQLNSRKLLFHPRHFRKEQILEPPSKLDQSTLHDDKTTTSFEQKSLKVKYIPSNITIDLIEQRLSLKEGQGRIITYFGLEKRNNDLLGVNVIDPHTFEDSDVHSEDEDEQNKHKLLKLMDNDNRLLDLSYASLIEINETLILFKSRLQYLNLSNNLLTGINPILSELSNLSVLNLSFNNIDLSASDDGLSKLCKLTDLNLSNNSITQIKIETLCQNSLNTLEIIDLSNNKLNSFGYILTDYLKTFRLSLLNLKSLAIFNNGFKEEQSTTESSDTDSDPIDYNTIGLAHVYLPKLVFYNYHFIDKNHEKLVTFVEEFTDSDNVLIEFLNNEQSAQKKSIEDSEKTNERMKLKQSFQEFSFDFVEQVITSHEPILLLKYSSIAESYLPIRNELVEHLSSDLKSLSYSLLSNESERKLKLDDFIKNFNNTVNRVKDYISNRIKDLLLNKIECLNLQDECKKLINITVDLDFQLEESIIDIYEFLSANLKYVREGLSDFFSGAESRLDTFINSSSDSVQNSVTFLFSRFQTISVNANFMGSDIGDKPSIPDKSMPATTTTERTTTETSDGQRSAENEIIEVSREDITNLVSTYFENIIPRLSKIESIATSAVDDWLNEFILEYRTIAKSVTTSILTELRLNLTERQIDRETDSYT